MKLDRLKVVLSAREKQLSDGVKTKKGTRNETIPLTSQDITRIEKEIVSIKDSISRTSEKRK